MERGVAVFDFDKTLIRQGSLKLLLQTLVPAGPLLWAVLRAAGRAGRAGGDRLEVLRRDLLHRTLAGVPLNAVRAAAQAMSARLEWKPDLLEAYAWHCRQGHSILIASGGLACYLDVLLAAKGLAYDALFATEMVVDGGILTGEMASPSCTWQTKAERVRDWLAAHAGESWGYGNLPNDAAMLALVDHPMAVPT